MKGERKGREKENKKRVDRKREGREKEKK